MSTQIEWKVGDVVCVAPYDTRWGNGTYDATITRIGRKYVTVGEGYGAKKADINTGHIDGSGAGYGQVWKSRAAYEQHISLQKAWTDMRRALDNKYTAPDGVTEEDIAAARKLLRL